VAANSSWNHWVPFFEQAGYSATAPSWPDDPPTVELAREDPSVFAGKSIGDIAAYQQQIIEKARHQAGHHRPFLRRPARADPGRPRAIRRHRGRRPGTLARRPAAAVGRDQILGRGAHQPRQPAPGSGPVFRGKFRYGFGNAVSEDEARQLYGQYHVAGFGIPIFQAAFANFNPRTEARADKKNPDRGPILIIGGETDHQVSWPSPTRPTRSRARTPASPKSLRSPTAGTRSPSTADGRK
jgi:non-heme chloroperoxidase